MKRYYNGNKSLYFQGLGARASSAPTFRYAYACSWAWHCRSWHRRTKQRPLILQKLIMTDHHFHQWINSLYNRGEATGVYGYIPPKISPSKLFYGLEMTSQRLLNMSIEVLYHPKKFKNLYPPPKKNKFLATYLLHKSLTSGFVRCVNVKSVVVRVRSCNAVMGN